MASALHATDENGRTENRILPMRGGERERERVRERERERARERERETQRERDRDREREGERERERERERDACSGSYALSAGAEVAFRTNKSYSGFRAKGFVEWSVPGLSFRPSFIAGGEVL